MSCSNYLYFENAFTLIKNSLKHKQTQIKYNLYIGIYIF